MSETKKELAFNLKNSIVDSFGEDNEKIVGYRNIKRCFYLVANFSESYRLSFLDYLKFNIRNTREFSIPLLVLLIFFFAILGFLASHYGPGKPEAFLGGTLYVFIAYWTLPAIFILLFLYAAFFIFEFLSIPKEKEVVTLKKFKDYKNSLFFREYRQKLRERDRKEISSTLKDVSLEAYSSLLDLEEESYPIDFFDTV